MIFNIHRATRLCVSFVFLAVLLNDTGIDKAFISENLISYIEQIEHPFSINEHALRHDLQSIIRNIE
jgi:hypothetical protein